MKTCTNSLPSTKYKITKSTDGLEKANATWMPHASDERPRIAPRIYFGEQASIYTHARTTDKLNPK